MWYIRALETGLIPDWFIRQVLRIRLTQTLKQRRSLSHDERSSEKRALIAKLKQSPIAISTDDPNRQHYEVPSEFFQLVLGKRLKYSCCLWGAGASTLDEAEEAMLSLTCERSQLADGIEVLDLGCGWGSLSLWIAERFPHCQVLAVSNSSTQREYVRSQCVAQGLGNVKVITADVAEFDTGRRFDRVLSIEMFEHMKNYERLMALIASWLKPSGKLFVHVFSHREHAYEFDASNPRDWMAQTFFSGGTMPSDDLLLHFQRDLQLVGHWRISGTQYARTLRAWLAALDNQKPQIRQIMDQTYGPSNGARWRVNWRLFFLVCAQVWDLDRGREYLVSHYLFHKRLGGG
jgi:cyclopropane-fatty-acyl-phospholipid synthase